MASSYTIWTSKITKDVHKIRHWYACNQEMCGKTQQQKKNPQKSINSKRQKKIKNENIHHFITWLPRFLNFVCLVPGRTFFRRLIDLTSGVSKLNHYIRLTCETREDLHMWSHFVEVCNGRSFILLSELWSSSDKELLFTDASGALGFATYSFR